MQISMRKPPRRSRTSVDAPSSCSSTRPACRSCAISSGRVIWLDPTRRENWCRKRDIQTADWGLAKRAFGLYAFDEASAMLVVDRNASRVLHEPLHETAAATHVVHE